MEDLLLLLKSVCCKVCTGASPGRDPIGPKRLDEKPCRAGSYINKSHDNICERSATCIRLHSEGDNGISCLICQMQDEI